MKQKKTQPSLRPPRVIWTDAEKARLIDKAVEIQAEHPNLSGLPLLRASIKTLPPSRRRKLIAVTQAPWFEPGVIAEIRRRTTEASADASLAPLLRNAAATHAVVAATTDVISELHHQWHLEHIKWFDRLHQSQETIIAVLLLLLREIQVMNSNFGSPVPGRLAIPVPPEVEVPACPRLLINAEADEAKTAKKSSREGTR
jgi:hypothetical protein